MNLAKDMNLKSKKICIIGAGSSGLAAAKNLLQMGFEIEVLEREDDLGGNWNFMKSGSRVYHSTHTISSKPFTQFPDFPMPVHFPDYPHHEEILAYFRSYAEHFNLLPHIQFECTVEKVEQHPDGGWLVSASKAGEKQSTTHYFALVIANGHNWHPKMPEYPGQFTGEILHSADYKTPDLLTDKRVLVVGGGNTGCDLAVEASLFGEKAYHSTRRGYWYSPKYVFGKPSDQVYDLLLGLHLPLALTRYALEKANKLTVGDITRVGLPKPDHKFLETHPIVNSQLLYHVSHGDLTPLPDISRLDGSRVIVSDGRSVEVDLILFCTGYKIEIPFIDRDHLNWKEGRPELFLNVFHPTYDDLFFVGLIQPDSGQFKIVHWQSVAIASFLRAQERSRDQIEAFNQLRREKSDQRITAGVTYKDSSRHYLEISHMDYLREIEKVIHLLDQGSPEQGRQKVMRPFSWAFPTEAEPLPIQRITPAAEGLPPLLYLHTEPIENLEALRSFAKQASHDLLTLRIHRSGLFDIFNNRNRIESLLQTTATLAAVPVLASDRKNAALLRDFLKRYPARAGLFPNPVENDKNLLSPARYLNLDSEQESKSTTHFLRSLS